MAVLYKPYRLNAIPATPEANSIYYTPGADGELVVTVTGNTGAVVYSTLTEADVLAAIAAAGIIQQEVIATPTIATRDALTLTANALVMVGDATADPSVTTGGAFYFFEMATGLFTLTSRLEDLNLIINWGDIQNIPAAVTALGTDVDGDITYNGDKIIGMYFESVEW